MLEIVFHVFLLILYFFTLFNYLAPYIHDELPLWSPTNVKVVCNNDNQWCHLIRYNGQSINDDYLNYFLLYLCFTLLTKNVLFSHKLFFIWPFFTIWCSVHPLWCSPSIELQIREKTKNLALISKDIILFHCSIQCLNDFLPSLPPT